MDLALSSVSRRFEFELVKGSSSLLRADCNFIVAAVLQVVSARSLRLQAACGTCIVVLGLAISHGGVCLRVCSVETGEAEAGRAVRKSMDICPRVIVLWSTWC